MAFYIGRRILQSIPLLLLITLLSFGLMNLVPYDAVDSIANSKMTEAQREEKREEYGLNDPMPVQYFRWLKNILRGEFGNSLLSHTRIMDDLRIRIPNTILLVLPSYLTAYFLAMAVGLYSASQKGKWQDKLLDSFSTIGLAVPSFWIALVLIYFFGYHWKLFPLLGMHTIGKEKDIPDFLHHLFLPYCVLVLAFFPDLMRYVRSSALTELRQDYVLVQRAFGASKREILFHHVARNVCLPMVSKLGMSLPLLVTGAVITESVFSWPGIGLYFVKAVDALDYPIVMAVLLLSGTLVILGNRLSDILYCLIDPRISLWKKEG